MKSLIVDFHGGCISVLAGMLLNSSQNDLDILPINKQDKILQANGYLDLALKDLDRRRLLRRLAIRAWPNYNQSKIRRAVKPLGVMRRWVNSTFRRPTYDVAWVSFPPALYQRVLDSGLAKRVVVYVSHRSDLWISKPRARNKFWMRFARDLKSGKIIAIASNRYDQEYIRFYTGISVPLIKPAPHHVVPSGASHKEQSHLLGPTNVNLESPAVKHLLRDIRDLTPLRSIYPNFDFKDLSQHPGIVLLPYSIYSISLVEYEFLGIPIFVPSDRWLMENNILDDVQLFPLYGRRAEIQEYSADRVTSSPNSDGLDSWLDFAYWKDIAGTVIWDSIDELSSLLKSPGVEVSPENGHQLLSARQRIFNAFVARLLEGLR